MRSQKKDDFPDRRKLKREPTKKTEKKKTGIKGFLLFLLFGIMTICAYFFLTHPFFSLQEVSFTGNQTLSTSDLSRSLQAYMGENLFLLDTDLVADSLHEHPMVASVDFMKRYPSTLEVKLTEHYPVAFLTQGSDEYPIDETGIIRRPGLFTSQAVGNILISGETKAPVYGQYFSDDQGRIDLIVALVDLNLYKNVSKITFGLEENTSLRYNDISVSLGPLENIPYKLSLLDKIVADLKAKGTVASKIRMDMGDNPVVETDGGSGNGQINEADKAKYND